MISRPQPSTISKLALIGLLLLIVLTACHTSVNSVQATSLPSFKTTQAVIKKTQTATPSPSETPSACVENTGRIIDQQIPSELLGEEISCKVYLPPCYSSNPDTDYAVLYMLHGQTSMDDQWVRLGLLSTMDQLLAQNRVHSFIIVLPNEAKTNLDSFHSKYGEAVLEEVIPYIEEKYRVCHEINCRAIGGLSRGGNWAIHLAFTYPEMFTAVGAHSAPLFYGEMSNITRVASQPEIASTLPIFFIDVGNKDTDLPDVLLFNSTLNDYNIQREYYEFVGYHDEAYWSAHVQDYLLWYNNQLSLPTVD